jgi:ERF superfamily
MSESTPALNAALAGLQAELPRIAKGASAKIEPEGKRAYSYKYADLADIAEQVMPLLGRHGLAFTAKPTMADGMFVLVYKLVHESGESDEGMYPLPDPRSTKPQSVGSMITYARRYCLTAVTGVAPDGEDDDATDAQKNWQPSAGAAFENAAAAPAQGRQWKPRQQQEAHPAANAGTGQQSPAQPAADLGDWEVKIAAVATMDEANDAKTELDALYDKGEISAERTNEIKRALTARVAQIRGPRPVPAPEHPQGAPASDDSSEGTFVRDFAAKVGEAKDTDTLRGLKIQLAKAVQAKHVTPETANDLTGSIKNRENELRSAA